MESEHFQGKSIPEHLREAREKGMVASQEIHGTEASGFVSAFCDAGRETAVISLFFWLLIDLFPYVPITKLLLFLSFILGLAIWKASRSALIGWARLERMHNLIEQERWEIEHCREQEREELIEMYRSKGFSGTLLSDAVSTLMSDDNRLLEVMLTEELGLKLESVEHPLKQGIGAFLGSIASGSFLLITFFFFSKIGIWVGSLVAVSLFTALSASIEKIAIIPQVLWFSAWLFLSGALFYFCRFALLKI